MASALEVLTALQERVAEKVSALQAMAEEVGSDAECIRLTYKADGVALALSFIDEALREVRPPQGIVFAPSSDPSLYAFLNDDGTGEKERKETFAMFSRAGTEAAAVLLEQALLGLHPADLKGYIDRAIADGHGEIMDTACREAIIGAMPHGSDGHRRLAVAFGVEPRWTPHGVEDAEATRALIALSREDEDDES